MPFRYSTMNTSREQTPRRASFSKVSRANQVSTTTHRGEDRQECLLKRDHPRSRPNQEDPPFPGSGVQREEAGHRCHRRGSLSDAATPRRTRSPRRATSPALLCSPPHRGFRDDYVVGEVARSRSHLLFPSTDEDADRAAASLRIHDFAFVKRSNGSFSYAILADRSTEETEEWMAFVVCLEGSVKMVHKKYWSDHVRLVREDVRHPPSVIDIPAGSAPKICDGVQHLPGMIDIPLGSAPKR